VPVIFELQKRGVRFGLNSNRAWEDVEPIIERFHLNGPFILENGAYFKETATAEPVLCADLLVNIPQMVFDTLLQVIHENFSDADLHKVDTTKIILDSELVSNGQHFYLNAFRKFSASLHHRFDHTKTFAVAEKLACELNKVFISEKIQLQAQAHVHGATVTVEIPGVNKGTGILFLKNRYPEVKFVAIGDGVGDVVMRDFVSELYAVSNAIPELKEVANFTASLPFTQGVKEILENFFFDNNKK